MQSGQQNKTREHDLFLKNESKFFKAYKNKIPSNIRPITRERVHLVTSGLFRSSNKDGGHTIVL